MRELYVGSDAPAADDEPLITDAGGQLEAFHLVSDPASIGCVPTAGATFYISSLDGRTILEHRPDGSWAQILQDGSQTIFDQQDTTAAPAATAGGPPPPVLVGKVVDRYGNVTDYHYDLAGHLDWITDPVGLKTTFEYTGNHVTKIIDPAGRVTLLGYTGKDLTLITDPDGSKRTFSYDPKGRKTTEINKLGGFDTDVYDDYGRAIEADRADGSVVLILARQDQGLPKLNDPAPRDHPAYALSVRARTSPPRTPMRTGT